MGQPSRRVVAWSLDRLEAYGLAVGYGDVWSVRRMCPPLVGRQLARAVDGAPSTT